MGLARKQRVEVKTLEAMLSSLNTISGMWTLSFAATYREGVAGLFYPGN
jgi:hypothetical protein